MPDLFVVCGLALTALADSRNYKTFPTDSYWAADGAASVSAGHLESDRDVI